MNLSYRPGQKGLAAARRPCQADERNLLRRSKKGVHRHFLLDIEELPDSEDILKALVRNKPQLSVLPDRERGLTAVLQDNKFFLIEMVRERCRNALSICLVVIIEAADQVGVRVVPDLVAKVRLLALGGEPVIFIRLNTDIDIRVPEADIRVDPAGNIIGDKYIVLLRILKRKLDARADDPVVRHLQIEADRKVLRLHAVRLDKDMASLQLHAANQV